MWFTVVLEFVTKFLSGKNKPLLSWVFILVILSSAITLKASIHINNQYTDTKTLEVKSHKQLDSAQIDILIKNQYNTNDQLNKVNSRVDDIYKYLLENEKGRNGRSRYIRN